MESSLALEPISVLITASGGAGAPGIIRSLRHNGERAVRVVAADREPDAVGLFLADAGYTVPAPSDPGYGEALMEICRREGVRAILPGISYEIAWFSEHREEFAAAGVRVAAPQARDYLRMDNKAKLYQTLEQAGVPVAPFLPVDWPEDLSASARQLGFPRRTLVLKHQVGSGGKGLMILNYRADMGKILEQLQAEEPFRPRVLMDFLPGVEYSSDLLVREGTLLASAVRVREQVRAGASFVGTIAPNPEVEALCREMMAPFDYTGNANIQVKAGQHGHFFPVEINPRLSGTVVLATAAGLNLPYLGVKLLLGEAFDPPQALPGTRMVRFWEEVFTSPNGQRFLWPGNGYTWGL